jgi:sigma-B regulation protein RsbU (phosphoserine phosphatase)
VHSPPERFDDTELLSEQSRSMLAAVGATDALAVPMIARGRVVGALGLVRLAGSPPFDEIDSLVATDIAHRAAAAVDNARLYRAQSDISTRLQQALLPAVPKNLLVRAAVRYLPARNRFDVGGDWYDLFLSRAHADSTVLVIGDVAGHDLQAGTTMSALRNLLRGIVVATDAPPQHVLESVDANMGTLGIRGTATALLMTVTPLPDGRWHLVWSNAGHMPPLLLSPDGGVEMLNELHGTLLGTDITQVRTQAERVVAPGTTLVLYTDGLVETRDATIDAGLTHLRRTAMSLVAPIDDPGAVAIELLARNHASSEDDTAMLVCHLPDLRS